MESVLKNSPNDGEVIPLTGDDRLQFKVFTMHTFSQGIDGIDDSILVSDRTRLLPQLKIMLATKAADCGVSNTRCRCLYPIGLAPSMYSLVQEMGRVDRNPLLSVGDNRYEVHISFTCVVKLFVRIMQTPQAEERATQLASMMDVLCLLVTPNEWQHVLMERYFEKPDSTLVKEKCCDFCSQCKMDTSSSTGRIHRDKLCCLPITFATSCTGMTGALIKLIKSKKDEIYHMDNVPNKMPGHIHVLCLQLVVKSII
jgi:hypothetical protein